MKVTRPLAGQVHRSQGMLESRMLGGREYPPRALQLVNAAQALQPHGIDQILLGGCPRHTARPTLGDAKVSVDGIAREVDPRILCREMRHSAIIPMSGTVKRGVDLFNSGKYWEAHEAWEDVWMPDRKGPDGAFYKGLIQIAAGCLHYGRHNRRGAVNKWRSGADYLRPYLPANLGVRVSPLVATVDGFLEAMNRGDWPELTMPKIEVT